MHADLRPAIRRLSGQYRRVARCFVFSFDNEQNSGRTNRVSVTSAVAVPVSAIAERLYGTERHPKTAFAL